MPLTELATLSFLSFKKIINLYNGKKLITSHCHSHLGELNYSTFVTTQHCISPHYLTCPRTTMQI